MQDRDKPQFLNIMSALCATFRVDPSEALLEGYWMALDEMPLDAFQKAAKATLSGSEYMPKPVQLLAECSIPSKLAAATAWPEVKSLATRSSGDHSDPIAKEAIRLMGGGGRLGMMTVEEIDLWGRKQFEELYTTIAETNARRENGLVEASPEVKRLVDNAPPFQASSRSPHWQEWNEDDAG